MVVTGTLDAPPNTGVTVNGIVAHRGGTPYGSEFAARVPLAPGVNEINVTATLLSRKQVIQTLTVTSSSESLFGVYASPNNSFAPTTISFSVVNINNLTIQQIELDFNGDGVVDQFIDSDFDSPISHECLEPGIYFPRITILDSDDVRHAETLVVAVQNKEQINNLLKNLWNGMNSALMDKNHSLAAEHLTSSSQKGYGEIFYLLLPHMNEIIPNYTAIVPVETELTYGEYAVGENFDGTDRVFFIQLLQDSFGVWRVDGM